MLKIIIITPKFYLRRPGVELGSTPCKETMLNLIAPTYKQGKPNFLDIEIQKYRNIEI